MNSRIQGLRCSLAFGVCACGAAAAAPHNGRPAAEAAAGSHAVLPQGAAGTGTAAANSSNPTPLISAGSTPLIPVSHPGEANRCKAGHYVGLFSGDYHSGAWFDGAASIMFATGDANGHPGFEFWLEAVEKPCTPGQEFCADAVVKGGKLRGNATPFADPNDPSSADGAGFSVRFEIDLTGELDCRTGKFKGKLENGCYDILSALYRFNGTIDGDYSVSTSSFTKGAWHVDEAVMQGAAAPAAALGGDGTWSAAYKDDSAPPTGADTGLCRGQSGFDTQI